MDLADIRKKARDGKLSPKTPAAAASSPTLPAVKTEPKAPHPTTQVPAVKTAAAPPLPDRDRLAELFELPGNFELATEESYLAALEGSRSESREDLCQWLTLSLGKETYALDIRQISEIIKPREVTEIPRTPDFILGIISLRGIIVPVFDLGRRLRLTPAQLGPMARIIVCHAEGRSAGLLVDRISQVVSLPERSVEPPPSVLSGLDRDLLAGVGRVQDRMLILLHLPSVLNAELV